MKTSLAIIFGMLAMGAASAGQQPPAGPPALPYGAPISIEAAKRVMAAAEAEAMKNNWTMAIVVLDSSGHIVLL